MNKKLRCFEERLPQFFNNSFFSLSESPSSVCRFREVSVDIFTKTDLFCERNIALHASDAKTQSESPTRVSGSDRTPGSDSSNVGRGTPRPSRQGCPSSQQRRLLCRVLGVRGTAVRSAVVPAKNSVGARDNFKSWRSSGLSLLFSMLSSPSHPSPSAPFPLVTKTKLPLAQPTVPGRSWIVCESEFVVCFLSHAPQL